MEGRKRRAARITMRPFALGFTVVLTVLLTGCDLAPNNQVAQAVGSGQVAFSLTDTDDAVGMIAAGSPVAIIYPDRRAREVGTLASPAPWWSSRQRPRSGDPGLGRPRTQP
jgi:hypothetical protein